MNKRDYLQIEAFKFSIFPQQFPEHIDSQYTCSPESTNTKRALGRSALMLRASDKPIRPGSTAPK